MSQTLSHPEPPRAQLPSITIGNSDFPNVCDDGTLFVDKTAKLASLFKQHRIQSSRPAHSYLRPVPRVLAGVMHPHPNQTRPRRKALV